jgi:hypothetical protein
VHDVVLNYDVKILCVSDIVRVADMIKFSGIIPRTSSVSVLHIDTSTIIAIQLFCVMKNKLCFK